MPNRKTIWLIFTLVFIFLVAGAQPCPAHAQDGEPQDEPQNTTYVFGEKITFRAQIETKKNIELVIITFQSRNETRTIIKTADFKSLGKNTYLLFYEHLMRDYALQPFSIIQYHFEVTLAGGDVKNIPEEEFVYADDRFEWQTRQEEGKYSVYWHEGDIEFGQDVLDTTQAGVKRLQNLLPYALPVPLNIFIYPDTKSLQEALHDSSPSWVAGHADPDLGVVIIALPKSPDQYLLMQQRIPHELMHIALYQETGLAYNNIPAWLNEGLASMAELYTNPDYRVLLDYAVQNDSLLPLNSLCVAFPREASNALLAYAQAASFTQYLYDSYGKSGMQALVAAYANGLDCEHGAEQALGKTLTKLERQWQLEALSKNVTATALASLLPWFVIGFIVLGAPIGLGIHVRNSERENDYGG